MTPYARIAGGLWLAGAIAAATVTTAPAALADNPALACISSHEDGLAAMRSARLIEAQTAFAGCATETCPEVIRRECEKLLADVARRIPSVVFSAVGQDERDLKAVRVRTRSGVLVETLDGRAIELDPGPYTFEFHTADGRVVARDVVIREGEKLRRVVARFPTTSEREQPDESDAPTSAYVLGGIGALAAVASGIAAWSAWDEEQELRDTCAPRCSPSEADGVRRRYLIADVLMGVAVVSLGSGTYLWLTAEPEASQAGVAVGARGTF